MALETCIASVSHDIDGAGTDFANLTLDTYPGENVSDFTTEALRLIKIMAGGYALPVHTGSCLLMKVTKTSSEEFNRKIFTLLDSVKTMEYKYKVADQKSLASDPDYPKYGPIALVSALQQAYGHLISFHDWPALATKLPESYNAETSAGNIKKHAERPGSKGKEEPKCFRCQGPHLVKDCPKKSNKDREKANAENGADSDATPAAKKAKTALAAWKYLEPRI